MDPSFGKDSLKLVLDTTVQHTREIIFVIILLLVVFFGIKKTGNVLARLTSRFIQSLTNFY
jgi:hypothetical protein